MSKKNKPQFFIAWADMPLCDEELQLIEPSHRIRPYLLCMDMDYFYYAFPCTSRVYNHNIRYESQKVILRTGINDCKSLVNLGEVFELPKVNLAGPLHIVNPSYTNEIVKKLNACSLYNNYPQEFIDYISSLSYTFEVDDLIESEEDLYMINSVGRNKYVASRTTPYPTDKSSLVRVDGLRYYVCPSACVLDRLGSYKYRSCVTGYHARVKELVSMSNKDYSKLYNLEPGMVISYDDNGVPSKMVIIENYKADLAVLSGEDNKTYSKFTPMTIAGDADISFRVVSFLGEERLDKLTFLRNKKLEEQANKNYVKKDT